MKRTWIVIILFSLLTGLAATLAQASTGESRLASILNNGFGLSWWTLEGGGTTASSGNDYSLSGTIGQSDTFVLNGGSYSLSGGFWNSSVGGNTPTSVTLLHFDVLSVDATTLRIEWSTASELSVQGFHLWRGLSGERSQALRVTLDLVETQGDPLFGAAYFFVDGALQPEMEYNYWLQEIDANGSVTEYGPVTARTAAQPEEDPTGLEKLYLPLLNR
jgi:hypothetical protein